MQRQSDPGTQLATPSPAGPVSGTDAAAATHTHCGEECVSSLLPPSITYTGRIIKGEDNSGKPTLNQFSIEGDLGEGSFGAVKLVTQNETNEQYAMKSFIKSRLRKQKEFIKNPITGETV